MSEWGDIMALQIKFKGDFYMKEVKYIKETETESAMGDKIYLCYFITEVCENESLNGRKYGVGIDMYTQTPSERTGKERKAVNGIFKTKLEAELFIQVLCKAYVTPISLEDIIEDNVAI